MKQTDFQVNINEIIVHGCRQISEPELHASIHNELQRILSSSGVPSLTHTTDNRVSLDGGTITIPETADSAVLGTHIAQAIYRGVQG